MVKAIVTQHQLKSGKMKIGLDNDTAQQKSDPNSVVGVSAKSIDLLTDIRSKLNALPIEVEFFWIEGHALEKYGKNHTKKV